MWQFIFWASLGAIAYSYLGYPLILAVLARLGLRGPHVLDDHATPPVCLIISAFNEERIIRKKIENSLALDYPRDKLQILVASDGCNDRTVDITRDYADYGVRLFHQPKRSGKSAVLNGAVATLDEDIVVFTDANSLFAADALRKLVRHFHDPRIGCVVGKLRYVDRHTTSVGKGEGAYWRYEAMLSGMESSLQSVLVANGSIFGIRRVLFPKLFAEVANDFQIPIEIASRGHGIIYEPEAVAFERSTIFWREEFQRKVRIILRGLTGFAMLRSRFGAFRRWQFFSRKLLRWSIGPLLLVNLAANAALAPHSVFFAVLLAVQIVFYLLAVNGWRMRKSRKPHLVFYLPFYFTMVNLAAVVAIAKFVVGERQRVWEKAESARFAPTPGGAGAAPASGGAAGVTPRAPVPSAGFTEPVQAREKVAKT